MTRPKVLFVGAFPPPGSGITGGNVSACRALLSSSFTERLQLLLLDSSRRAVPLPVWERLRRASLRWPRFLRLVHRERPDAMLAFSSGGLSFVEKTAFAAYARMLGIPTVLSVRSGHFIDQVRRSVAFRALARVLLRAPARVLCQGQRWQELYGSMFRLPPSRCPIVDAWVASEDLLRVGRERSWPSEGRRTVLFLGALEGFKGIFDLLDAAECLRADGSVPEFVVAFAGAGVGRAEAQRRAEERGLSGVVRFDGLLSHDTKVAALRAADVFVLPSHTEGLPNAMIEAMAAALPVIVTAVGSVPDVIVHGENGLLVPPRDPAVLARELHRLLGSPALRMRLGREAHRTAVARFGVEGAAALLEGVVRDVVQERRPRWHPAA